MVRSLPSTSVSHLKRKSSDIDQATKLECESFAADSNLQSVTDLIDQPVSTAIVQSSLEIKNISDVKPSAPRSKI